MTGVKPSVFVVDDKNKKAVEELCRATALTYHVNGICYVPEMDAPVLASGDEVAVVVPSIVDRLASLDESAPPPPPDPYIVVPCVDKAHRRVNDLLTNDPSCRTCLGLGIVRVLREHVPVVHRKDDKWVRGDDAVSRLADLGSSPP